MGSVLRLFGLLRDKLFGFFSKKKLEYKTFHDPLGNFTIQFPKHWKFDSDVAVVDGRYTISFDSKDIDFTIAVDANLGENFDFDKYAHMELESPTAGIIASISKDKFRGMPAYSREFKYESGGKDFFGGGSMFYAKPLVFSINWSAKEKDREKIMEIFDHMRNSLLIHQNFSIRSKSNRL